MEKQDRPKETEMSNTKFFDAVVLPKLDEVGKLCRDKGYEFQGIVAYRKDLRESKYYGNEELMVRAKIEYLAPDR